MGASWYSFNSAARASAYRAYVRRNCRMVEAYPSTCSGLSTFSYRRITDPLASGRCNTWNSVIAVPQSMFVGGSSIIYAQLSVQHPSHVLSHLCFFRVYPNAWAPTTFGTLQLGRFHCLVMILHKSGSNGTMASRLIYQ
jgi:hypothetical protein